MNLSFLNPAFLWALPAALLPIAFHLLLKRPPRPVPFSDLKLLSRILERARPQKKLHERLLLLLRVLALAAILLFFARPVVHWGNAAAASDSSAIVVLLDRSFSMQAQEGGISHWDRAKSYLRQSLGSLGNADRSSVIVFSDGVEQVSGPLSNDHSAAAQKLDPLAPGYRTTHLLPALQSAYQILANSNASNKSILILSDMARHGWMDETRRPPQDWTGAIKNHDPAVKLLYPEPKAPPDNVSIQDVQVWSDLNSGTVRYQAELRNWSARLAAGVGVRLEQLQSDRGSQVTADLGPNEKRPVSLAAEAPEESAASRIALRPDAIAADNEYFLTQAPAQRIRVLCVEEHAGMAALSGESYFFRQALQSPPSQFEVMTVTLGELKKIPLKSYAVVALINPSEPDEETAQHVRNYAQSGGGLLVTLGERSAAHGLRALDGLLPAAIQEVKDTPGAQVRADDSQNAGLQLDQFELEKLEVRRVAASFVRDQGTAALALRDGTPLLVLSAEPRAALWTTTLDRSWNNFASKPIFVPLMRGLVQRLAAQAGRSRDASFRVGEPFRRQLSKPAAPAQVRFTNPEGAPVPVKVAGLTLTSEAFEVPGIYRLQLRGEAEEQVAVNVDAGGEEGNGAPISAEEMEAILPESRWIALRTGDRFAEDFRVAVRGKEFSRPLIALAGLLLIGETWLARRRTAA